jgi:hypothetical protein
MVLVGLLVCFGGSLFVSSGYFTLRNGERIPPKGWFRFANELIRRQRYSNPNPRWPASPLPPPSVAIPFGLVFIAAGVSVLLDAAFGSQR